MFFQDGPELKNQFTDDKLLTEYLKFTLPAEVCQKIFPHLEKVGADAATQLLEWAGDAEAHEPELVQYDPWGNRIDEIKVSQGWKNFDAYSASEGIVGTAYAREFKEYSRLYQMSLLYLFHPSSAIASCPLAMTDGAARAIELLGKDECGKTSESEKALLRVLTPLAKLFTAKSNVKIASEVVESFGGAGYVEDSGIPRLLRDGQVLAIWEGTTNVLSLDMLRAFQREQGLEALNADIDQRVQSLKNNTAKTVLSQKWQEALADFKNTFAKGEDAVSERARDFSMMFSKIYIASLMFEYADKTQQASNMNDAQLWLKTV